MMPINDNDSRTPRLTPSAEARAQAALMLVESLIHGLVERELIHTADAVEIIETAKSVQTDVAEEADGEGADMWHALALLTGMSESLKFDLKGAEPDARD